MKLSRLTALLFVATASALVAAPTTDQVKTQGEAEALISSLHYQQGTIPLQNGIATLNVQEDMQFLNGHDASSVLVNLWGNPPDSEPLGMLVPAGCDLLGDCWAVIITYEESGYVKDGDAEKIDYTKLLASMQKDTHKVSGERQKQGYPTVELLGWAAPPRYDRDNHKLYWAKELKFGATPQNTLNYDIRVLGRRGVLVLNAIAGISSLPAIEQAAPKILASVDFNPGNRYADFSQASGDKVAEYGIAALIAGGVAAKVGLFKGLWVLLLAGKKFVILGVAAIVAAVRKFLGRNKSEMPR